jgi:hypothetical protein
VSSRYLNTEYGLPTNDNSVSVMPNTKVIGFSSTLPDYKAVLRAPFREWAQTALPGEHERSCLIYFGLTKTDRVVHSSPVEGGADIAADQQYVVVLQEDGLPCLPVFNIDLIAPNDARLMLKAYIELTWSEFLKLS